MKRFSLIAAVAMLSVMTACGTNNDSDQFDQQQTINDTMNQQNGENQE